MSQSNQFESRCPHCLGADNHYPCQRCKLVFYCNEEHRASHLLAHMSVCSAVCRERTKYEVVKSQLPFAPESPSGDSIDHDTILGNHVYDVNSYIEARINYARVLESLHSRQAAEKRIKLLRKALIMLPDNKHVNACLKPLLGLMFRLKSDEEIYKFMRQYLGVLVVKYKQPQDRIRDYNKLNALSDIELVRATPCSQILRVAFVILKLRVIAQLQDMPQIVGKKTRIVPKELKDKAHFGFFNALATAEDDRYTMSEASCSRLIERLIQQVRILFFAVHEYNHQVWDYLMAKDNPANMFESQENSTSHTTAAMIRIQLREPFEKTPGAEQLVDRFLGEVFLAECQRTTPEIKVEPDMWEEVRLDDIPMAKHESD
ncbi:zinc finger MYND domain-containing protein [Aspergillus melleus]|uniref:zinc finger MYND domain-containing protein n=1 Tax=Aspergillus melleus TaxID=138277 RepID=UPI001E8E8C7B|nr:uncharacterized protein LDX57_007012 [Aspergillus melleus]KAH8429346.1 hypothetical protein LDX57_007012 [Aspergillus melleus]